MPPQDKNRGDSAAATATLESASSPNNIQSLNEILSELHGAEFRSIPAEGLQVAILPKGKELADLTEMLEPYKPRPRFRQGHSKIQTLESLVAITQRFRDGDTAGFALRSLRSPSIVVIFDYHGKGGTDDATQRRCLHRASYAAPVSDEWATWLSKNNEWMSQANFAEFLENRIQDVVVVQVTSDMQEVARGLDTEFMSPSQLVGFSRGLQVNVNSTVRNAVTLSTGELSMIYEETHQDGAGAPLRIPTLFAIAIPIFLGGQEYQLPVRLRYRVAGGKVTWSYSMYRHELAFDDAFQADVTKLRDEGGIPVFFGSPE